MRTGHVLEGVQPCTKNQTWLERITAVIPSAESISREKQPKHSCSSSDTGSGRTCGRFGVNIAELAIVASDVTAAVVDLVLAI